MQMTYLAAKQCKKLCKSGTLTVEAEQTLDQGASLINYFWDLGGTWVHSQVQLFVPEQEDLFAFELLAAKQSYAPRGARSKERDPSAKARGQLFIDHEKTSKAFCL